MQQTGSSEVNEMLTKANLKGQYKDHFGISNRVISAPIPDETQFKLLKQEKQYLDNVPKGEKAKKQLKLTSQSYKAQHPTVGTTVAPEQNIQAQAQPPLVQQPPTITQAPVQSQPQPDTNTANTTQQPEKEKKKLKLTAKVQEFKPSESTINTITAARTPPPSQPIIEQDQQYPATSNQVVSTDGVQGSYPYDPSKRQGQVVVGGVYNKPVGGYTKNHGVNANTVLGQNQVESYDPTKSKAIAKQALSKGSYQGYGYQPKANQQPAQQLQQPQPQQGQQTYANGNTVQQAGSDDNGTDSSAWAKGIPKKTTTPKLEAKPDAKKKPLKLNPNKQEFNLVSDSKDGEDNERDGEGQDNQARQDQADQEEQQAALEAQEAEDALEQQRLEEEQERAKLPVKRIKTKAFVIKYIENADYKESPQEFKEILESLNQREVILERHRSSKIGKGDDSRKNINKNKPGYKQPQQVENEGFRSTQQPKQQQQEKKKDDAFAIERKEWTEEELVTMQKVKASALAWEKQRNKEEDEEKKSEKEIKFLLNKLTPDNYDSTKKEILYLASQKQQNCEKLIDIIIEKAWTEQKYTKTYSQLCEYLGQDSSLVFDQQQPGEKKKKNLFKVKMVQKLQDCFEEKDDFIKAKEEKLSDDERAQLRKKRTLGNLNFIAELALTKFINLKVINLGAATILHNFIVNLRVYRKSDQTKKPRHEDNLEGLIGLIDKTGRMLEGGSKFDEEAYKNEIAQIITALDPNTADDDVPHFEGIQIQTQSIFDCFDVLRQKEKLSKRIESLIVNLQEKKKIGWKEASFKSEGPKKISDLHDDYYKEQDMIDQRAQEYEDSVRDNMRDSRQSGGRPPKTVYVEAVQESQYSKDKLEELKNAATDVNVSVGYKPKRGKTAQQQPVTTGDAESSKTMHSAQIAEAVNKIFRDQEAISRTAQESEQFEESKSEAFQRLTEGFTELLEKAKSFEVVRQYFEKFADTDLKSRVVRCYLPQYLIKKDLIKKENFVIQYATYLKKATLIACDFPELENSLASIYVSLVDNNLAKLEDLQIDLEDQNEDEKEEVVFFLKDLFGHMIKQKKDSDACEDYKNGVKNIMTKVDQDFDYEKFLKKFT